MHRWPQDEILIKTYFLLLVIVNMLVYYGIIVFFLLLLNLVETCNTMLHT
jgi:hypothetical protein